MRILLFATLFATVLVTLLACCLASGAKWMGMRDAGISFRPPSNGTLPAGYVEGVIAQLTPTMADMEALGLLDKMYVCE